MERKYMYAGWFLFVSQLGTSQEEEPSIEKTPW